MKLRSYSDRFFIQKNEYIHNYKSKHEPGLGQGW